MKEEEKEEEARGRRRRREEKRRRGCFTLHRNDFHQAVHPSQARDDTLHTLHIRKQEKKTVILIKSNKNKETRKYI